MSRQAVIWAGKFVVNLAWLIRVIAVTVSGILLEWRWRR